MDFITLVLLAAIIIILGLYFYQEWKSNKYFPPGPTKFPVIGNAIQFGGLSSHLKIQKFSEKYGPVMGAKLGPIHMVIMSDAKIVREAFSNPAFTGKPDLETFNFLSGGKYGIISSDGDTWVEQRRFSVRHLRDLGFGKSYMEDLIMEEVNEFIVGLKAEEGMPISLKTRFSMAVLNSIWMLLHGHRYKHDDPKLMALFKKNHEAAEAMVNAGALFLIPRVARMMPNISGYNTVMSLVEGFRGFFKESIKEHEQMLQVDGPARDLVEAYLMEMQKQKDKDSSFNQCFGMNNLLALISDMFIAGHETTSATLEWLLLYVAKNPRVQRKIHDELDSVVGKSRRPTLGDKPSLVYMEAALLETLRISSIAPLGVPHMVTEDVEFHGYKLPKGTLFAPNLWTIHHDPQTWTDPNDFVPERFISDDGKSIVKTEDLIPFSVGKRACVGELMARNEMFLFATNIFQRFRLELDPKSPEPSTEPEVGFVLAPKLFKVVMTDRLN